MNSPAKVIPLPTRMECSSCGASMTVACDCHVAYVPAGTRAAMALTKNPERSDRSIAIEIGTSPSTVGLTRKQLSNIGQLETPVGRIGIDGKKRKVAGAKERKRRAIARIEAHPERQWVPPTPNLDVKAFTGELGKFMTDFSLRFTPWLAANPNLDDEARFALVQNLSEFSAWMQSLAQKIDRR